MPTLAEITKKLQEALVRRDNDSIREATEQLDHLNNNQAYLGRSIVNLCNIAEDPWVVFRTYGRISVEGKKPGERYSLTPLTSQKDAIKIGDVSKVDLIIPASAIAEDIANSVNGDGGTEEQPSFHGVFICSGDEPTEEELRVAEEKLAKFYRFLVSMADASWSRQHDYRHISDIQRRAAKYLHLEREWLYEIKTMTECPACGGKMPVGAAVHAGKDGCGAVLDREKAIRFGLLQPDHAPKARASAGKAEASAAPEQATETNDPAGPAHKETKTKRRW